MKKLILLLSTTLLLSTATMAQHAFTPVTGSELSVGLEGALPLGGWDYYDGTSASSKIADFGVGLTLKYAYNFNETVAATFQTGYIYFPGKDLGGAKLNVGQIPIKAGVRLSMNSFYLEPQIGVSSINVKGKNTIENISATGSTSAFTYAIGVGARLSNAVDLGLRYEAMSNEGSMSFLGLRLGYMIPFNKH